jgi:hypothetical protein
MIRIIGIDSAVASTPFDVTLFTATRFSSGSHRAIAGLVHASWL